MQPMTSGYTLAGDDERRLALRQEKRRSLAEIQIKFEKIAELEAIIRGIDADSDAAADLHAEKCKPLQDELAKIDNGRVAAILKKAKPKDTAARRAELLRAISTENIALETLTEANGKETKKLRQEIDRIRSECTESTAIENDIVRLATPAQLDRHWLLGQRLVIANKWLEHCQSQAKLNASLATDRQKYSAHSLAIYEDRLRQWQLAVEDAQQERQRLQSEQDDLRAVMLDDDHD